MLFNCLPFFPNENTEVCYLTRMLFLKFFIQRYKKPLTRGLVCKISYGTNVCGPLTNLHNAVSGIVM